MFFLCLVVVSRVMTWTRDFFLVFFLSTPSRSVMGRSTLVLHRSRRDVCVYVIDASDVMFSRARARANA